MRISETNIGITPIVCLAALLVSSAVYADQEALPNLLADEHDLSLAFETPHTKWAKPYAQGATRVLFFAPWYQGSTKGREAIELIQRFDLEADLAYYIRGSRRLLGDGNPRPYLGTEAGTTRVLRLLKHSHDVMFLNHVPLKDLPELVQKEIRRKVRAGAGVVVVGDVEELPFARAKRVEPPSSVSNSASYFKVGKGRAVLLKPRKKLKYSVGWDITLDYQMAKQGRAILWAANKMPRPGLAITASSNIIERDELPEHSIAVTWNAPIQEAKLTVKLRRWDGYIQRLGTADVSSATSAQFALPLLRAGGYHAIASVKSDRGIENWSFTPFTVTSTNRLDAVALAKDWAEIGETFKGRVDLDGDFAGRTVRVRLMDKHGRVLARQGIVADRGSPMPFAFTAQSWLPMLVRVEAALLEGDREVSSAYAFLRVTKRHQDEFNFVIWNYPSGDLAPYALESYAQYGATAVLQQGSPPLSLAASNMSWVPYTASYRASSHTTTAMLDEHGIMKNGCTYDEAKMAKRVRDTVEHNHVSRGHGVFTYSLGDENAVRGSCLSEHCLMAYRKYLENTYGDIAALNAEWESGYASFDALTLLEEGDLPADDAPKWFKEYFAQRLQKNRTDNEAQGGAAQLIMGDINDEIRALQAENFARWYDRQAFQCHTYLVWCKRYMHAFRELDPKSRTGFEGTDSFTIRRLTTRSRQGGDLDAFVRDLEYFGPYRGPANEVVRSIAPSTFPAGNWIGYSMDGEDLLEHYWEQVTNCMNMVQWWRWDNLDGYHGFLSPMFVPFKQGSRKLVQDTQVVRDGLGTLLMHCEMQDDDVAMLYSMPSTYIGHFDGNRTYGNYNRDHKLWYKAIHESGLQFRYVTDRMLRLGEFDAKRYKVLILPLAFALGPDEAGVIREFVRQGGMLLADVRPGTYDGHCKPLADGILDDVLGIKRTGKQDAVFLDRMRVNGEIDGQPIFMEWGNYYGKEVYPQMKVDPTVAVTTGTTCGQANPIHYWSGLNHPVCVVNEYGAGRGVLLNFPIYNAPLQPLVEGILASAGVKAEIQLRDLEGERVQDVEITRWQNRGITLMALFGTTREGDVIVLLPEDAEVYDLKAHKAFGRVREFTTQVRRNRASFFALLPKPSPRPQLAFQSQTAGPGDIVSGAIHIPKADGLHAVRISATAPDGSQATWFRRDLLVDKKSQTFDFPIAYNDAIGEWTLRATDLYTNQEITERITVERP